MTRPPFGVTNEKQSLGLLLWQTTQEWQRAVNETLSPHQIPHAQFVLLAITLWHMLHDEVATQAKLVQMSRLDKMTVSKSLRKLEEEKFITREIHTEDSRVWSLTLTKAGERLAKRLVREVEATDKEFFGKLAKADQKVFLQTLAILAY